MGFGAMAPLDGSHLAFRCCLVLGNWVMDENGIFIFLS